MAIDGDDPGDREWMNLGASGSASRRPRRLLAVVVMAGCLVAAVLVATLATRADRSPAPTPSPSRSDTSTQETSAQPESSSASTTPSPESTKGVVLTEVGHALLPDAGGWELFAAGVNAVVRIQPKAGRVITTSVSSLRSDGPVALLVGPNQAVVRPMDFVPGVLVPDNQPARELSWKIKDGGRTLPGPDPAHLWAEKQDGRPSMVLLDFYGMQTGDPITIPGSPYELMPDGTGYFLLPGIGGTYEINPSGVRRVTTGAGAGRRSTRLPHPGM